MSESRLRQLQRACLPRLARIPVVDLTAGLAASLLATFLGVATVHAWSGDPAPAEEEATTATEPAAAETSEEGDPDGAVTESAGSPTSPKSRKAKKAGKSRDSSDDAESAASKTSKNSDRTEKPEADDENDLADEDAEEPPKTRVTITSDAPANVFARGEALGPVTPEAPVTFEVSIETETLVATAAEAAAARWTQAVELSEDEPVSFEIPMLEILETLRKTERRDKVFRVLDDGIMWTKQDNGRALRWAEAVAHCRDSLLGGWDNWRLPSLAELESLQALWSLAAYKIVGGIQMTDCCQWSTDAASESHAWNFNFRFRRAFETDKRLASGLRALCIREMEADELEAARYAADPKVQKQKRQQREERLATKKERQLERRARKKTREAARESDPSNEPDQPNQENQDDRGVGPDAGHGDAETGPEPAAPAEPGSPDEAAPSPEPTELSEPAEAASAAESAESDDSSESSDPPGRN